MRQHAPIRVALVIDELDVRTGGTEGQILNLVERLDRRRVAPKLFCLQGNPFRVCDDVQTQVLGIRVRRSAQLLLQIRSFAQLLRRERFQIVQTHFRDANLVGVVAARWAGVPVVLSTRRGVPYWSSRPGLWLLRMLDHWVDTFVANSEATRAHYSRLEGFAPSRCSVIHNGLEPARFRSLDDAGRLALRASLGIEAEAQVVGIVANLRPVKGHLDFLQAASQLHARFPAARFLVVGGGEQASELSARAQELGLERQVLFLGSRRDAAELMQIFDVGVLASHFESFSNAILEYLAAGLPVVATDVGGAREAVEEGLTGFLVPPQSPDRMAERLAMLLAHPGGARAWRGGAHRLPERFHVDTMVRSYEQLYATSLESRR